MKKSLVIVLAILVTLTFMLSACGTANQQVQTETTGQTTETTAASTTVPEVKDVTVKIGVYPMGLKVGDNEEPDAWVKDREAKFKQTYPNVTVEAEILNWDGGTEKLDLAVASGSAPDLAYTINNFGGVSKYAKMGALEAIDPFVTEEDWKDYATAVETAISYDGKHYAWPWLKLVTAMAVNMDMVKERKVENLLPLNKELRDWTYDEFLAAAKALTFSSSGGSKPDVFGYGMFGKDIAFYNILFAIANGGSILDKDFKNYTLNSKEALDGLQFMVDLVNVHKVTPDGTAGLGSEQVMNLFYEQKIAMVPAMANVATEAKAKDKPFNVDFVAFPHGPNAPLTAWNNVGSFLVFKQSDEYKNKMVMEFGKFITNAENAPILKDLGVFPARNSAGNLYADDPTMTYFYKMSDYGNSAFSRSIGLAPLTDWISVQQAMILKEKTPAQAVDEIGEKIKEALAK